MIQKKSFCKVVFLAALLTSVIVTGGDRSIAYALGVTEVPVLTLDPNKKSDAIPVAPLAGVVKFTTDEQVDVILRIEGEGGTWVVEFPIIGLPVGQTAEFVDVENGPPYSYSLPIFGLKPNNAYTIQVELTNTNGSLDLEPLTVETNPAPADFPDITKIVSDPDKMEPGFTLMNKTTQADGTDKNYMIIVDNTGDVVWYSSELGNRRGTPTHQLSNGHLQYIDTENTYDGTDDIGVINWKDVDYVKEIDLLGNEKKSFTLPDYNTPLDYEILKNNRTNSWYHHELRPMPDDRLFALIAEYRDKDLNMLESGRSDEITDIVGDLVIEFDTTNTETINEKVWLVAQEKFDDNPDIIWSPDNNIWSLATLLSSSKKRSGFPIDTDWSHTNAVIEHPVDQSIIISSNKQSAIVNFKRNGTIKWILGTPTGWGDNEKPHLLKPDVNSDKPFAWPYYQHAPMITHYETDANGIATIRLLLFDNSRARAVEGEYEVPDVFTYSRAVEYEIIEEEFEENGITYAGTIEQVWQYPEHPTDGNGAVKDSNGYLTYQYPYSSLSEVCQSLYKPNGALVSLSEGVDPTAYYKNYSGCWPLSGYLTEKQILSTARGDADQLPNGNVLITYSDVTHVKEESMENTLGWHARIIEVTKPGNIKVFDLQLTDKRNQVDENNQLNEVLNIETYRSERIGSLYPPSVNTNFTEHYNLYFPSIYDGVDDWKNYITVQAKNPADTVNVTFTFYNPDGSLAQPDTTLCPTCTNPSTETIAPYTKANATANFRLYGILQHQPFNGTAVITADKPVIAMANSIGPDKEAFNIHEAAKPRTELFFSKVFDGKTTLDGRMLEWVNLLQVQNVESDPVTISIYVYDPYDGSLMATLDDQVIPAHGKFEIRPSAITGSTPTRGTIRVLATGGRVAGMMKYQYGTGLETESFSIYEANIQNTVSYLPKLYDGFGGNENYISVLNVKPTPVTVALYLYNETGYLAYKHEVTLGENEKLDTTPSSVMCGSIGCANFSGAAIISATGPVYATTNAISSSVQDPREAFSIYEAATPATTLLFPKVFDGFNGWVNNVSIQNVDSADHMVTVYFYDFEGNLQKTHEESIQAHGQFNFSPQTIMGAPFNNTMIVSSDAPNSIAGVMRYERTDPTNPNIRCMTIYEGIAQ